MYRRASLRDAQARVGQQEQKRVVPQGARFLRTVAMRSHDALLRPVEPGLDVVDAKVQ